MQAYQSPPCPYCGITWNPPGAQACANCRNALPSGPPAYAPPGYAPPGYAPPGYSPPGYGPPGQPQPPAHGQPPSGYPGPQGPPYAAYPPAGYPQSAPYQQPPQYGQFGQPPPAGYPVQGSVGAARPGPAGTTVQVLGQTLHVPFEIPPVVLQYQQPILYAMAGVILLAVVLLGVGPAVAASQVTGAEHALQTARTHQSRVDTAFGKFFSTQGSSNDPNAEKTVLQAQAKSFNDGLASVKSDEAALKGLDQQLSWIRLAAPSKSTAIAAERHRLAIALTGLQQADQALTAAVNEVNVALPYIDAVLDYTKMGAALGKHDLVTAGALYPDAQQKMELAMSLDHGAGLPPAIAKQVSSFNDALNSTESLIQALQAKDAAGIKKSNDAIQAALKAMASPAESVPADYESKTFGPMQKAYDSAMKALKS
ncbi:MAG TPA: hypothetical protein VIO62_03585 [Candidatus Dormibacteraeota bacterium]